MRIILICAIMLLSGCATTVQLEYGRLTFRAEQQNLKNRPKTIEEVFHAPKKTIVDKRLLSTVEWLSNPSKAFNNVEHRTETQ